MLDDDEEDDEEDDESEEDVVLDAGVEAAEDERLSVR